METMIFFLAGRADRLRARFLRGTLQFSALDQIFRDRPKRQAALFLVSFSISLITSLFFPLVVLLIGPIVYGYPHLLASLRFVKNQVSARDKPSPIHFFTTVFFVVSAFRIAVDLRWVRFAVLSRYPNLPELITLFLLLVGCFFFYRENLRSLVRAALISVLVSSLSWYAPLNTVGFLLLAHNFIAFFYWIGSCSGPREKKVAWGSTAIFCVTNILLFAGAFDGGFRVFLPAGAIHFAQLDLVQIGTLIFPSSRDPHLLIHATMAYAFGQSMHYFVWMKAIPDERHTNALPTSFIKSAQLLKDEWGRFAFGAAIVFVGIGLGAWAFLSVPIARTSYFAVSAYHTYLELLGLGFVRFLKSA